LIVRTVNSYDMTSCYCIIGRSVYLLDPTPKKMQKHFTRVVLVDM